MQPFLNIWLGLGIGCRVDFLDGGALVSGGPLLAGGDGEYLVLEARDNAFQLGDQCPMTICHLFLNQLSKYIFQIIA